MPTSHSSSQLGATHSSAIATRLYDQGDGFAQQGRYDDALSCFDQVLRIYPEHGDAWVFRAVALIYLECYQEALDSCNQALRFDAINSEAWLFRGVALHRLGHYQEAYLSYDRALGVRRRSLLQHIRSGLAQLWTRLRSQRLFRMNH